MTIRLFPAPPSPVGDADRWTAHECGRIRTAAGHARRLYPGVVGELLFRELTAYADFGYRFGSDGLVPRLAEDVLSRPVGSAPEP